jgi:hypothetical protein
VSAFFRQEFRGRATNTAGGAGDDGGFPRKRVGVLHMVVLFRIVTVHDSEIDKINMFCQFERPVGLMPLN